MALGYKLAIIACGALAHYVFFQALTNWDVVATLDLALVLFMGPVTMVSLVAALFWIGRDLRDWFCHRCSWRRAHDGGDDDEDGDV